MIFRVNSLKYLHQLTGNSLRLLVLGLMPVSAIAAAEQSSGYWELGAGVSYLQSPYYLGSDESKNYAISPYSGAL